MTKISLISLSILALVFILVLVSGVIAVPILKITINNPNTGPAQSKTINASVNANADLNMSITTGTTCNDTLTFIGYIANSPITFISEADNGKRVCYQASKSGSITAYNLSNEIAGIDKTAPTINITYPLNTTYNVNVSELNYTYSDINPDSCWYSRDLGATNSTRVAAGTNFSFVTSVEGNNTWLLYCNDTSNNLNTSVINFMKDTTAPTITITNPNTSPAQSKTITANGGDGTLTMSVDSLGVCDGTLTFIAYSSQTFTSESDNGKTVCYKSVDAAGNIAYSLSDAIAGIDKTAPTINIIYPLNTTYNVNVSELNYTYSDINPDSCWYSRDLGATNSTRVAAGTNFSFVTSVEGNNTWLLYCNDTSNNLNTSVINFMKDTTAPTPPTGSPTGSGGGTCTTTWTCSDWSACTNYLQTRTCSYPAGFCAPTSTSPPETQTCTPATPTPAGGETTVTGGTPGITGGVTGTPGITGGVIGTLKENAKAIGIIVGVLVALGLVLFGLKRRRLALKSSDITVGSETKAKGKKKKQRKRKSN